MPSKQKAAPRFANYIALKKYLEASPTGVQSQFPDLYLLLNAQLPLEAAMAYTFLRIEMLWNRCLYGGLVKLHRAEAGIARRVVDKQHLTRDGFQKLFNVVYGAAPDGKEDFKKAETIRDRVIHGKDVEPADLRYAIGEAIDHATALIAQVQTIAGLNLGDMRGYKTKIEPLDRRTTKWVLKGMGFAARA